jgi:hypothetical protein
MSKINKIYLLQKSFYELKLAAFFFVSLLLLFFYYYLKTIIIQFTQKKNINN